MKTGKKAIIAIAVALVVYVVVGLLFMPRDSKVRNRGSEEPVSAAGTLLPVLNEEGKTPLADAEDSLSYAVSIMVAGNMPRAIAELGIKENAIDRLVQGIQDAFPVKASPEEEAYAHGVVFAAAAADMLDEANRAIYQSDTTKKVDRGIFLEGLKAVARGDVRTMSFEKAYEYYNESIFRRPSEEFIKRNSTRSGVETISRGVQVKVERKGTGEVPLLGSTVGYIYKASFINGCTFESSKGNVVEARVGTLKPGLALAMTTLPVGTKCKVYVPWQLAYGSAGSEKVPPFSAIVYDLEIVSIVK